MAILLYIHWLLIGGLFFVDWTLFTAGIVNDNTTRDLLVSMVHASAANLATFTVFPTTYNTSSGQTQGGTAR